MFTWRLHLIRLDIAVLIDIRSFDIRYYGHISALAIKKGLGFHTMQAKKARGCLADQLTGAPGGATVGSRGSKKGGGGGGAVGSHEA